MEIRTVYASMAIISRNIRMFFFWLKNEQIWYRSQRRQAAKSMKFLINIDFLDTLDVE